MTVVAGCWCFGRSYESMWNISVDVPHGHPPHAAVDNAGTIWFPGLLPSLLLLERVRWTY